MNTTTNKKSSSLTPYNYFIIHNLKQYKLINWKGKYLKGRHMYIPNKHIIRL
jgi:hypothetical protein